MNALNILTLSTFMSFRLIKACTARDKYVERGAFEEVGHLVV